MMPFAEALCRSLLLHLLLLSWSTVAAVGELLLPSTCNEVLSTDFAVRLDLYYFYLLEYPINASVDLAKIDRAIATFLVQYLRQCDGYDRPVYGVLLTTHEFSQEDGICQSLSDATTCRVTHGMTSVLLNGDVLQARNASLVVIKRALMDTAYLADYSSINLARSEFVRSIGSNVVLLSDDSSDSSGSHGNLLIAIIAGSIGIAALILAFALLHRKRRNDRLNAGAFKMRLGHYRARRRRYFHQLNEKEDCWMAADASLHDNQEYNGDEDIGSLKYRHSWSVSDLTSDSQSIRSSLPMDRISEEAPSFQTDDEVPSYEHDNAVADAHIKFIAHWKDPVEGQFVGDDVKHLHFPDEDELTPVRRNHIDLYDAEDAGVLRGFHFIEDESPESLGSSCVHDDAAEIVAPSFTRMSNLGSLSLSDDEELLDLQLGILPVGSKEQFSESLSPCDMIVGGGLGSHPGVLRPIQGKLASERQCHRFGENEETILCQKTSFRRFSGIVQLNRRAGSELHLIVNRWAESALKILSLALSQKRIKN